MDEAVSRVTGAQLAQLMFPRFDDSAADSKKIAQGMNASPGAAVGKVVFDSYTAVKWSRSGEVGDPRAARDQPRRPQRHDRRGRHPDLARRQDLARRGRRPRHGQDLRLRRRVARRRHQAAASCAPASGIEIHEGDVISIDGTSGDVFLGEVPVVDSPVVQYFEDGVVDESDDLVVAVDRMMKPRRRRAADGRCAPTPTPPRTPRGPAASARRASGCAAPSTCSSASAASSSSG